MRRIWRSAAAAVATAATLLPAGAAQAERGGGHGGGTGVTPIVLFPAYHFTKLQVTVKNQTTDPACPASGTFIDVFLDATPSPFSGVCRD